jgi:hypothetical protein
MTIRPVTIAEINESHPLNRLAMEYLDGYGVDQDDEIAALALFRAWWDDVGESKLLRQKGGPTAENVMEVIGLLSEAKDAAAVMMYLTIVGGEEVLKIESLRELDGDDIAREILSVIVSQFLNNTPVPA